MDGVRFDRFARTVAGSSRRTLLKAALGGALAALTAQRAGAAGRPSGSVCRKHGDCASNYCAPADATGRRRCAGCVEVGSIQGCGSDAECCQDTPAFCVDPLICFGGSRCCHLAGGSCVTECDCCNFENCINGICGGAP